MPNPEIGDATHDVLGQDSDDYPCQFILTLLKKPSTMKSAIHYSSSIIH